MHGPLDDLANRGRQVEGVDALPDVRARPAPERGVDHLTVLDRREHRDLHVRVQRRERLEAGEAIDAGKLDVEQDEVGPHTCDEWQQVAPVADLSDELHLRVAVEHHPDGVAHQPMIIGENDPDRAHLILPPPALPLRPTSSQPSRSRYIPRMG